jgi:predicted kinase
MERPLLVVVTGPAGSGSTSLAHALARELPAPAICRDEIKEGIVESLDGYEPAMGDPVTRQATETFFGVVRFLVDARVSLVAEGAFQHRLWREGLEATLASARVRVVHCVAPAALLHERVVRRAREVASRKAIHGDPSADLTLKAFAEEVAHFERPDLGVPSLTVDTTSGYAPDLLEIVAFARR